MKRPILLILTSLFAFAASAQRWNNEDSFSDIFVKDRNNKHYCDTRIERADSVINFTYNALTGEFKPVEVRKYSYDLRDNLTVIHLISLPDRLNVLRQVFEYDAFNNQTGYSNYIWENGKWEMSLYVKRTFSPENKILTEVFHNRDAQGNFKPYMQHFYNYDGNRIISYLRQVKNAEDQWYNFSYHYYIYDSYGRLIVLYGQYINGPVFWERTSVYDNALNRLSQRYLRQLKYNPVIKQNLLTNITFEEYSYNIYGNVSEILYHSWSDDRWEVSGKAIYYYSLLMNKKVSICHNGNTICVDAHAVKAHLEHGDKLGACENDKDNDRSNQARDDIKPGLSFDLYPNPAKNNVTIKFKTDPSEFESGMILSGDGRTLVSFRIDCRNEISLNIGNLRDGTYIVKITGTRKSETRILVKK